MGHLVTVHSYRGGTGKSNISANLAYLAAMRGKRVAVLDTDLQSPGVHVIFGLERDRMSLTLSDFLFGRCEIEEAAYDLSVRLELPAGTAKLFLLPSSMRLDAITRIVSEGYDAAKLNKQLGELVRRLQLDILFLDSHPGLSKETMLTCAISDALVILVRPDSQDFHGTAVLVEVADRIGVPLRYLVANKVIHGMDRDDLRSRMMDAFRYDVIGLLPLSEEMALLGSREIFARRHPSHALTNELGVVVDRLIEDLAKVPSV